MGGKFKLENTQEEEVKSCDFEAENDLDEIKEAELSESKDQLRVAMLRLVKELPYEIEIGNRQK
ncbi:hypothetical protein [Piscirickettsia salmonis]|uniref:hypothetical protein n=1 Tax=Piscirickettsia salmonis TaxID=1238 RepID=UPI0006BD61FF|nr:hypothetical protein [Piscirickettsia salmonis]ALA26627.1 type VI secretion protein [Piscirickettsia salmonis]APS45842.1 hypothetical protein AVI48_15530 [Piscirickettsia salmonis]APS49275.1 hypothetical protein AVI49_16595 [Piscirickettsia salmonis]QGO82336.1 hypothetical protein Psal107_03387 [Piscirickettsia salmonis]QGP24165.1 hypothetical protein Psal158_03339 [Piscirickettsia salmonis]